MSDDETTDLGTDTDHPLATAPHPAKHLQGPNPDGDADDVSCGVAPSCQGDLRDLPDTAEAVAMASTAARTQ
jgi:hypothetical protein